MLQNQKERTDDSMQINTNTGAAMFEVYRSAAMHGKVGALQPKNFAQMVQDVRKQPIGQTEKTTATKEISKDDEMAAFKQEIYEELAEINKMHSSATLSNAVHITEDGFQRMKDDSAYRKKIMNWLREDAIASHGMPYGVHITTRITGAGATSYGANVYPADSAAEKAAKKQLADKKAEGAFYRSERADAERRAAQRKRDEAFIMRERQQREMIQKMIQNKHMAQNQHVQGVTTQSYSNIDIVEMMLGQGFYI